MQRKHLVAFVGGMVRWMKEPEFRAYSLLLHMADPNVGLGAHPPPGQAVAPPPSLREARPSILPEALGGAAL